MQYSILDNFRLKEEREDLHAVLDTIYKGVVFKGTNLWVLIFAIFVASLGLNVNSTAVIIGAMLISPLMGPIMGMGTGIAVHDITLLRLSLRNYAFATVVSLLTSTSYFLFSPINEAHSEILARTSPNIYDVLIALFGGLAGILALSSKNKGNVIPGVAIATALMPPLCTAGYGLATFQFKYFFGSFYLYIINTVFIALASFITLRALKYPIIHGVNKKAEKRAQTIIWFMVMITLLPSIYFGYDLIQRTNFHRLAQHFISLETEIPNTYLLEKKINTQDKSIELVFGGMQLSPASIQKMKQRALYYQLDTGKLKIRQGFAYIDASSMSKEKMEWTQILEQKQILIDSLTAALNIIKQQTALAEQLLKELTVEHPQIVKVRLQPMLGSDKNNTMLVLIDAREKLSESAKGRIKKWLGTRLQPQSVEVLFP